MGTQDNNATISKPQQTARNLAYIGLFVAVLAVCSYISVPIGEVPFTLQTFAVFVTVGLLGGKRGTAAIASYIILGMIGVPVFAGFKGGVSVIVGPTGGYIVGFLFCGLEMWAMQKFFGENTVVLFMSMVVGAITYFTFGTIWFMAVYLSRGQEAELLTVLSLCVIPYLLPDLVKMIVATVIVRKLKDKLKLDK